MLAVVACTPLDFCTGVRVLEVRLRGIESLWTNRVRGLPVLGKL